MYHSTVSCALDLSCVDVPDGDKKSL